jgi:hypothetical protein
MQTNKKVKNKSTHNKSKQVKTQDTLNFEQYKNKSTNSNNVTNRWPFGHPLHPSTKIRYPIVSLPKEISMSTNKVYRKLMVLAIHSSKNNKKFSLKNKDFDE